MVHTNRIRRLLIATSTLVAGLFVSIAPTVIAADEIPGDSPNPPINVVATPEPGKITVTWKAPVDGAAVVDYVAVVTHPGLSRQRRA